MKWIFRAKCRNPQNLTLLSLSLYSLYCADACKEFAGPISASLRLDNTAPFKKMLQRWRAVGNTVEFDRSEIRTSDLSLQRRTRCHSTNLQVKLLMFVLRCFLRILFVVIQHLKTISCWLRFVVSLEVCFIFHFSLALYFQCIMFPFHLPICIFAITGLICRFF